MQADLTVSGYLQPYEVITASAPSHAPPNCELYTLRRLASRTT
jgi:hypothetical protein